MSEELAATSTLSAKMLTVWTPINLWIETNQTRLFIVDVIIKFFFHFLIITNIMTFDEKLKYSTRIPQWVSNEADVNRFIHLLWATIAFGMTALTHIFFHIALSAYHRFKTPGAVTIKASKTIHLHTRIKTLFVLIYLFIVVIVVYGMTVSDYLLELLGGNITVLSGGAVAQASAVDVPTDSYSWWVLYRYLRFTYSSIHIWIIYLRMVLAPEHFPPSAMLLCIYVSTGWNAGLFEDEYVDMTTIGTLCGLLIFCITQFYSLVFFVGLAKRLRHLMATKQAKYVDFSTENLLSKFLIVRGDRSTKEILESGAPAEEETLTLQEQGHVAGFELTGTRETTEVAAAAEEEEEELQKQEDDEENGVGNQFTISDIITFLFTIIASLEICVVTLNMATSAPKDGSGKWMSLPELYEESAFVYMLVITITMALFIAVTTMFMSLLLYAYTNTAVKFNTESRVRSAVVKEILPVAVLEKLLAAPSPSPSSSSKGNSLLNGDGSESVQGSEGESKTDAMIVSFNDIDDVDDVVNSSFGQVMDFAQPIFKGSKIMYRIQGKLPSSEGIDSLLTNIGFPNISVDHKCGPPKRPSQTASVDSGSGSGTSIIMKSSYNASSSPKAAALSKEQSIWSWLYIMAHDLYVCKSHLIPLIFRRKWHSYSKLVDRNSNKFFFFPVAIHLFICWCLVIFDGGAKSSCDEFTKLRDFGISISIMMTISAIATMMSVAALIYAIMIQDSWKSVTMARLLKSLASTQLLYYPYLVVVSIIMHMIFVDGKSSEVFYADLFSTAIMFCLLVFFFTMVKLCPQVFRPGKVTLIVYNTIFTKLSQQILSHAETNSADEEAGFQVLLRIFSALSGLLGLSCILEYLFIYFMKIHRRFICKESQRTTEHKYDQSMLSKATIDFDENDSDDEGHHCRTSSEDHSYSDSEDDELDSMENELTSANDSSSEVGAGGVRRFKKYAHHHRTPFFYQELNHKDLMGFLQIIGVAMLLYYIFELYFPIGNSQSSTHTCDITPALRFKVVIGVCVFISLQQNLISVIIQQVATRNEVQMVRWQAQLESKTNLIKALLPAQIADDVLANRTSLASLRNASAITRGTR